MKVENEVTNNKKYNPIKYLVFVGIFLFAIGISFLIRPLIKCSEKVEPWEYVLDPETNTYIIKANDYINEDNILKGEVTIPSEYKNKPVGIIGESAFRGFNEITKINIPNTVKTIKNNAFSGCTKLETLVIPSTVEMIESGIVSGCYDLKSVTIPFLGDKLDSEENAYIGYLFNCSNYNIPYSLQNVKITGGSFIENKAFSECDHILQIILPNTIKRIGNEAFAKCSSLVSINLPDSVESLGFSSFSYNRSLRFIYIKSNIINIPSNCFYGCGNLVIVTQTLDDMAGWMNDWDDDCLVKYVGVEPDEIYTIDSNVYLIKKDTKEARLIRYTGFGKNTNVPRSIKVNEEDIPVKTIEEGAFYNCKELNNLTIFNPDIKVNGEKVFDRLVKCKTYFALPEKPTNWDEYLLDDLIVYWNINESKYREQDGIVYIYDDKEHTVTVTNHLNEIEKVIIPDSIKFNTNNYRVSKISERAFYNDEVVKEVSLPIGMLSIGQYAFYDCVNLKTINITPDIKSIGKCAFEYTCLNYIYVPKSVTSIGEKAIDVDNIVIYLEVGSIPSGWHKSWTSDTNAIHYSVNDFNYVKKDNFIYILDFSNLSAKLTKVISTTDELEIPSQIEYQGTSFNVTSIETNTFSNNSAINKLILPSSIKTMKPNAFKVNLNEVYYKGNIYNWCDISFENYSSTPMSSGSSLYMYNANSSFEKVEKLIIPSGIEKIKQYQFAGINNLTSIVIDSSVKNIGLGAFYECKAVVSVDIPFTGDGSNNHEFGYIFSNSNTSTNSSVPYTLKDVNINKETTISNGAFKGCKSIHNIRYTNNLTSIGANAFEDCEKLKYMRITESIKYIGANAFLNCKDIVITLDRSVLSGQFESGWAGNAYYISLDLYSFIYELDGVVYILDSSMRAHYPSNNNIDIDAYIVRYRGDDEKVAIPSTFEYQGVKCTVSEIRTKAFKNSYNLNEIIIPSTCESIYEGAFDSCNKLNSVYYDGTLSNWCFIKFEDDLSQPMICGSNFFYKDESNNYVELIDLVIPSNVTIIRPYTFSGFNNLKSVKFSDDLQEVGSYAFYDCNNIETIYFNNSLKYIYMRAFLGCKTLKEVVLPNSVEFIGEYAFGNCTRLTKAYIPISVKQMGEGVWYNVNKITIYCEASSKPSGWDISWKYNDGDVVWDYKNE